MQQQLAASLYRLFRPLARLALRHGVSVRDVFELYKKASVDVAREEYGIRGRPTNKARIAALTGLTRAEVSRLLQRDAAEFNDFGDRHPLRRVVTTWMREAPWCGRDGEPLALSVDNDANGFAALVRHAGGDLPYQTVLRELLRMAIVRRENEQLRLVQRGFIPAGSDASDRVPFLGSSGGALLDTIVHNILRDGETPPRFERKLSFRGLSPQAWQRLSTLADADFQQLLEKLNDDFSNDVDAPEDAERMTGVGIYLFDTRQPPGGRS